MEPIVITDYDPAWPGQFEEIAGRVRAAFAEAPFVAVEHLGSTAVPGLAAKPIIDLNVVVPAREDVPDAIERLARLGYVHQGDLGILGREAFRSPPDAPTHHLYLCTAGTTELRRQVAFRDFLRANGEAAESYSALKRKLVTEHGMDRRAYSEAKTEFIEAVLARAEGRKLDEVIVVDYDPQWPALFAQEAEAIRQAVGGALVAVEHVGSTSIPGLAAKPIIDILVGVTSLAAAEQAVPALEALGYECRGENGIPGRLYFRKGLVQYRRTHHLHMVETGHEQWIPMLTFRDYMRAHPEEAWRYEALKRGLAAQFRDDRRAYTDGKEEFVRAVLAKAQEQAADG